MIQCRLFRPKYKPFHEGGRERQQRVNILSFVKYDRFNYRQRPVIDANTLRKMDYYLLILFRQFNLLSKNLAERS